MPKSGVRKFVIIVVLLFPMEFRYLVFGLNEVSFPDESLGSERRFGTSKIFHMASWCKTNTRSGGHEFFVPRQRNQNVYSRLALLYPA